jgi:hypothetical protein
MDKEWRKWCKGEWWGQENFIVGGADIYNPYLGMLACADKENLRVYKIGRSDIVRIIESCYNSGFDKNDWGSYLLNQERLEDEVDFPSDKYPIEGNALYWCNAHYMGKDWMKVSAYADNILKKASFQSAEEMYELIKSGTDLYNPYLETLISVYNESGSIIEHGIDREKAEELIKSCKEAGYDEFEWVSFLPSGGCIYDTWESARENGLKAVYTSYDWCLDAYWREGWMTVQEYIESISENDENKIISSPEEMKNIIFSGIPVFCPACNTLITNSSEYLIVFTGHDEEDIALAAEECRKEGFTPEEWNTRILADAEDTSLENTLELCEIYFERGEDWYSLPDYLLALKEWEIRFMYDGTYYIRTIKALTAEEARESLLNSIDTAKEYAVLGISEKK